jgi:hypothetical protein
MGKEDESVAAAAAAAATRLGNAKLFLREDYEAVDPNLPALLRVLRDRGAGECSHKHGTFYEHLLHVYRMLKLWDAPNPVALCGLFHSAYSNSYVNLAIFEPNVERRKVCVALFPKNNDKNSLCVSVCISLCPCLYTSLCVSRSLSVCLSVSLNLSVYLFSLCLFTVSTCLSVSLLYLSLHVSQHLSSLFSMWKGSVLQTFCCVSSVKSIVVLIIYRNSWNRSVRKWGTK